MIPPVIGIAQGHADQQLAVSPCGGDQGPPRQLCVASFHSDTALILTEKFVVVDKRPVSQRDRAGGDNFGHSLILHTGDPQTGHIRRSGVVPVGVKPVGIFKMAVCHAQLPGLLIHLFHKGLHISAAVSGKDKGRVVSGVEQQTIKKRLHGDLLPYLQVQGGALCTRIGVLHRNVLTQVDARLRRH